MSIEDTDSSWGTGGMVTKIKAAEWCTIAGCNMIICNSKQPSIIIDITKELERHDFKYGGWEPTYGTHFIAMERMQDRQWWILHSLSTSGTIIVDQGCLRAITGSEKISLFAVGISKVEGQFNQLDCLLIKAQINGILVDIAKGLTEYSSREVIIFNELEMIKGKRSQQIIEILGYGDCDFAIHRQNLAILPETYELLNVKRLSDTSL